MRPTASPAGRSASRLVYLVLALISLGVTAAAQDAGKPPSPAPAKPSTAKPSTAKPATAKPPAAKPATAKPPTATPAPPPTDLRYRVRYTTGEQVTESVAFLRGPRERFELADMVLIRQHDQKRAVQVSLASQTYLVTPLDALSASQSTDVSAPAPAPGGKVILTTSIVDTTERKMAFGQQARRVKITIERQPQAGACDAAKQRIETDGWYIDMPKGLVEQRNDLAVLPAASRCRDEIQTVQNGDPAILGFPIAYKTTYLDEAGKPAETSMEVIEFEVTALDAALFEIPEGFTAASSVQELTKAVSNASEQKLVSEGPAVSDKKPGTIRVAVPEVINKTAQVVDTRALRTRLIGELTEANMEAIPLAAMPQTELDQRAKDLGCDYIVIAQVTELKASKPGGLGRMIKATAGQADAGKDITEAKLTVQLVAPGAAKPRYSTNTSGKDGGIGVKTGLGLARVAGSLYLRYASPMGAFNMMRVMNMNGMGMLGNPALVQMQYGGVMGTGRGLDRTAAAGMFLMDQAMAGASAGSGGGPSFDTVLAEALEEGAKKVVDNLKR